MPKILRNALAAPHKTVPGSMNNMSSDPSREIRSLALGVRAVALIFTLILSYFNIRLAFHISGFQTIFSDMLGGKPLPLITDLIIRAKPIWICSSIVFAIAAIAAILLVRSHKHALFATAGITAAIFLQIILIWTALFAPLQSIISNMSSGN